MTSFEIRARIFLETQLHPSSSTTSWSTFFRASHSNGLMQHRLAAGQSGRRTTIAAFTVVRVLRQPPRHEQHVQHPAAQQSRSTCRCQCPRAVHQFMRSARDNSSKYAYKSVTHEVEQAQHDLRVLFDFSEPALDPLQLFLHKSIWMRCI